MWGVTYVTSSCPAFPSDGDDDADEMTCNCFSGVLWGESDSFHSQPESKARAHVVMGWILLNLTL